MSSVSQPVLVLPALAQAFAFFFAALGASSVAIADEAPTAPSPEPPAATTATAQDLGPTTPSQIVTASLILKVRHPDALERAVASTQDPNGGSYHRFLSLGNFVAQYAPSAGDIAAIERYLARFGIRVTDVYANQLLLKATGTADAFNRAFTTDIHDYTKQGRCFHRPRHAPAIPVLLRDLLLVVGGLSDEALFRPKHVSAATPGLLPKTLPQTTPVLPTAGATATGVPGSYTVGDVANLYNINPLYRAHIDGTGRTIGIATLANFVPDDAYTYWALTGLNVNPNRIRQVHVDGGGELSSVAGSVETALDVQQAGGLAPGAKMIVYDAPNTDAGFMDVFYQAASDNLVDSLSVSWGLPEEFYYASVIGSDQTAQMLALHQVFLEAAAQGISLFAAAGDQGAYDVNSAFNQPFPNLLSVDSPASDPAITAAGGTTTPISKSFGPGTPPLVVPTEQVWGWDYLRDYFIEVIGSPDENAFFPVGSGGGVSIFWSAPWYQTRTAGIRVTEPGQSLIFDDGSGPQHLLELPAGFAGRNLPDVSLDADPFSGFLVYSSGDGGLLAGYGGTSFVAPQLNGVSALLEQAAGGRIGLWNPMLYRFKNSYAKSASSPLTDIVTGDNWYYAGRPGYEPGAGLGVLNVANLSAAIANERASCH